MTKTTLRKTGLLHAIRCTLVASFCLVGIVPLTGCRVEVDDDGPIEEAAEELGEDMDDE